MVELYCSDVDRHRALALHLLAASESSVSSSTGSSLTSTESSLTSSTESSLITSLTSSLPTSTESSSVIVSASSTQSEFISDEMVSSEVDHGLVMLISGICFAVVAFGAIICIMLCARWIYAKSCTRNKTHMSDDEIRPCLLHDSTNANYHELIDMSHQANPRNFNVGALAKYQRLSFNNLQKNNTIKSTIPYMKLISIEEALITVQPETLEFGCDSPVESYKTYKKYIYVKTQNRNLTTILHMDACDNIVVSNEFTIIIQPAALGKSTDISNNLTTNGSCVYLCDIFVNLQFIPTESKNKPFNTKYMILTNCNKAIIEKGNIFIHNLMMYSFFLFTPNLN